MLLVTPLVIDEVSIEPVGQNGTERGRQAIRLKQQHGRFMLELIKRRGRGRTA